LKDMVSAVRWLAALSLGEIGDVAAVPALADSLSDANPIVRMAAALALGRLRSPAAMAQLAAAQEDTSADVRRVAAWALEECAGRPNEALLFRPAQYDPTAAGKQDKRGHGQHQ
jgi:HEAT repeat protein